MRRAWAWAAARRRAPAVARVTQRPTPNSPLDPPLPPQNKNIAPPPHPPKSKLTAGRVAGVEHELGPPVVPNIGRRRAKAVAVHLGDPDALALFRRRVARVAPRLVLLLRMRVRALRVRVVFLWRGGAVSDDATSGGPRFSSRAQQRALAAAARTHTHTQRTPPCRRARSTCS